MKLLIVKTSSFGDILHTFPALTDAARNVESLVCDWLVEDAYQSMPAWHPAVRNIIPVSMRKWRRFPWLNHVSSIRRFVQRIRLEEYDLVLDAQGLLKSAALTRLARGRRTGFDRRAARESLAARLYDHTLEVPCSLHAVDRNRELFAAALRYPLPETIDYGLDTIRPRATDGPPDPWSAYLVFIPGTTWSSKRWPVRYWRSLAELAAAAGWRVRVTSGPGDDPETARHIAADLETVEIRSGLSVDQLALMLSGARAAVSVDSGPGHLAAALGVPGVSIYGATDPGLTGTRAAGQVHLRADYPCAPCFRRRCQFADTGQIHPDCYATVPPVQVWSTLRALIQEERSL